MVSTSKRKQSIQRVSLVDLNLLKRQSKKSSGGVSTTFGFHNRRCSRCSTASGLDSRSKQSMEIATGYRYYKSSLNPCDHFMECQGNSKGMAAMASDKADGQTQWEFSCDLEVDYESEEIASIVYNTLAVDKELQPDKVKRQMTVSNGKLSVK